MQWWTSGLLGRSIPVWNPGNDYSKQGKLFLKGYGKVELVIFCETTFYKQHDMTI